MWLGTDFALASPKSASFNSPDDYHNLRDDHDHLTNFNDDGYDFNNDGGYEAYFMTATDHHHRDYDNDDDDEEDYDDEAKSASFNFTSIFRKSSLRKICHGCR